MDNAQSNLTISVQQKYVYVLNAAVTNAVGVYVL